MNPVAEHRETIARLREELRVVESADGPVLPFGVPAIDTKLVGHGLARWALHEVTPANPSLADEAAATLFLAGIAARMAKEGRSILWVLSRSDLYAPGLAQAGIGPDRLIYAHARKDEDVLALAEDSLRQGCLGAVVAEVRTATMTHTRRLQLAAADGRTPILLLRHWRRADRKPFEDPSCAMTRWGIATARSAPLTHAGVGRARWQVELLRQRNGNPFTITVEACDDQGRLALPSASRDRATAADRATARAA